MFYGYSGFTPWDVGTFFSYYAMAIVAVLTFSGWKIVKKTRFVGASEVDLVRHKPSIDAYEEICAEVPVGFWTEILQLGGLRRRSPVGQDA